MKTTKTALIACVLALAACTSDPARTVDASVPGGPDDTLITVVNDKHIQVSQEPIVVRGQGVAIRWFLRKSSGYKFPDKNSPTRGIVIQNPGQQFPYCDVAGDGLVFVCIDLNSEVQKPVRYKYSINVIKTDGTNPLTWDPAIVNDY